MRIGVWACRRIGVFAGRCVGVLQSVFNFVEDLPVTIAVAKSNMHPPNADTPIRRYVSPLNLRVNDARVDAAKTKRVAQYVP